MTALSADMRKRRRWVAWILLPFSLLIMLALVASWFGIIINETQSYPRGFYQKRPLDRPLVSGQLVLACPNDTQTYRMGMERHYLPPGPCPIGSAPLIKKIAAMPGDQVEVSDHVKINGKQAKHSFVYPRDGENRPMPQYPGGTIAPGYVLLLSDYKEDSFDGRYTGPIPVEQITHFVRPVWTFN
jgi:conjugative transfer signal peptidase TraF